MNRKLLGILFATAVGLGVSPKAIAGLQENSSTLSVGDESGINGADGGFSSGPTVNMSISAPGSISPQQSFVADPAGDSASASTGLFNLNFNINSITGSGSSSAMVTATSGSPSSQGQGSFVVNFKVAQTTTFSLTSTLSSGTGRLSVASVDVEDTNITSANYGTVVEEQVNRDTGSGVFHDVGQLSPADTYALSATVSASADSRFSTDANASGGFNIDFEVPEPSAFFVVNAAMLLTPSWRRPRRTRLKLHATRQE